MVADYVDLAYYDNYSYGLRYHLRWAPDDDFPSANPDIPPDLTITIIGDETPVWWLIVEDIQRPKSEVKREIRSVNKYLDKLKDERDSL